MNLLPTLRAIPLFGAVPDDQLQWLLDHTEAQHFSENTVLFRYGEAIDALFVLLEGRIRIDGGPNGEAEEVALFTAPATVGVLPFSRMKTSQSFWHAETPVHWLALPRKYLRQLPQTCYELTETLVQQMTTRVRDFTKQAQQEEKMASLGRLSAGLAHELNNPVAAVIRSVDALKKHLQATPEGFKAVMAIRVQPDDVDVVNAVLFRRLAQKPPALSLLERSRREDELTDWLDDQGLAEAVDLTDSLVEYGFEVGDLEEIAAKVPPQNLAAVLGWVVNNLVTESLVREIADASQRIGTLVGSIKSYTHMDRGGGKSPIALREGIESTLALLSHKLKAKHIATTLDIPDDLPTVCGWAGELNQVWTNLIDNAADALPDGGQLLIRAEKDREFVLTKIIDNGSGIAPEALPNIFDPFFTTKEIGKGTGLGLDIVQGIIRHHNGSIKVTSEPGHTEFRVCLPTQ